MGAETLADKARRIDAEIRSAGGLGAYWIETADPSYTRLVDPETGDVLADRESDTRR